MKLKRTKTCGEANKKHVGEIVNLNGWVSTNRDHGGLIFIDLRDRYGKTQITFKPDLYPELAARAKKLRMEAVIAIRGEIKARPEGNINPQMETG